MIKELQKLVSIIKECEKHRIRMVYAYDKVSFLIPLNAGKVTRLKEEEISHLDQYVFRFTKLQDAIGQKLFRVLLEALGEEMGNKPFIDVFNRLEQLGIVADYARWQELRIIRNETTQEYDDNKQELAEKLTALLNSKTDLLSYLTSVLNYIDHKNLLK